MRTLQIIIGLFIVIGWVHAADIAGKKAVLIVAYENFRDEEFLEPRNLLESKGVKVTVASSRVGKATGMLGAEIQVDMLVKDVNVAEYDAVIFVGGTGATEYFDDPVAHKIAQDAVAQGKIVAAICIAPAILANAGVLRNKSATCFATESDTLKKGGARYTRTPLERDGKIITAEGPKAAKNFAEAIVAALSE